MVQKLIVIIIVAGVMVTDRLGWWRGVKGTTERWVVLPAQAIVGDIGAVGGKLGDGWRWWRSGNERVSELEREVARLRGLEERVAQLSEENQELKSWLKVPVKPVRVQAVGQVIRVTDGEAIVTGGKNEGIEVGMVVAGQGIVWGAVVQTGEYASTVRLVTDEESKTRVWVGEGRIEGWVKGTGAALILDEVIQGETVRVGDRVVTAGEGFPEGLLVGTVGEVLPTGAAVYQQAKVIPMTEYRPRVGVVFL